MKFCFTCAWNNSSCCSFHSSSSNAALYAAVSRGSATGGGLGWAGGTRCGSARGMALEVWLLSSEEDKLYWSNKQEKPKLKVVTVLRTSRYYGSYAPAKNTKKCVDTTTAIMELRALHVYVLPNLCSFCSSLDTADNLHVFNDLITLHS